MAIFGGTPNDYARLGRMLDDIGLERTAVSPIPTLEQNPLSENPAHRRAGVAHLTWALDCCEALGVGTMGGPLHSTYGHFTGLAPSAEEKARARDFHREVGDIAAKRNIRIALEALNRFECYSANTMDDLCAYVASVGHPAIGAVYDTFHADLEEADPVAAYTRNAAHVIHVHISENDVPWAATYRAIRESGYDGWLTIESFGRVLPALGAATKIWRDLSDTPEEVYRDGYLSIRDGWAAAQPKGRPAPKPAAKAQAAKSSDGKRQAAVPAR